MSASISGDTARMAFRTMDEASSTYRAFQESSADELFEKSNHWLDRVVSKVVDWTRQEENVKFVQTVGNLAYLALAFVSIFYMPLATATGALIGAVAGQEFVGKEDGFLTRIYTTIDEMTTESICRPELGSRTALAALLAAGALWRAPSILGFMWGADAGARARAYFSPKSDRVDDSSY